jgi:hypothetical protein
MKRIALAAASVAMVLIAGCGGQNDPGGEGSTGAATLTSATAKWDATNACALLDKSAVGAALGDKVIKATLGLVNQASGPNAATSECIYMLESGAKASLMTRSSPIADNTDDAIKMARGAMQQTVSAFTAKKVEDVAGLGKAAFFVPGVNQLNVFIDDKRFVILTISSAANSNAKDIAVTLFEKIQR